MGPVNMFLGADPLLANPANLEEQLKMLDMQQQRLKSLQELQSKGQYQQVQTQQPSPKLIWDEIDDELAPMSNEQKNRLFQDADYTDMYDQIQGLVQVEILNLVKGRIEGSEKGKELLGNQLKVVRKLKTKIIEETNKEMEMFRKFREFSKDNPGVTYDEFIKANI